MVALSVFCHFDTGVMKVVVAVCGLETAYSEGYSGDSVYQKGVK
jgi:hypothetical protein